MFYESGHHQNDPPPHIHTEPLPEIILLVQGFCASHWQVCYLLYNLWGKLFPHPPSIPPNFSPSMGLDPSQYRLISSVNLPPPPLSLTNPPQRLRQTWPFQSDVMAVFYPSYRNWLVICRANGIRLINKEINNINQIKVYGHKMKRAGLFLTPSRTKN